MIDLTACVGGALKLPTTVVDLNGRSLMSSTKLRLTNCHVSIHVDSDHYLAIA